MGAMEEYLQYAEQLDPLWAVVVAAAVLALVLLAKLWRPSLALVVSGVLGFAIAGAAAAAGYYGYVYFEDQKRIEERRALDERADALFTKTIEPDSVFACIDGSPAPAIFEACERSLFAEPQRVAAAVAIVTQRIAFLQDALAFAAERDPSYANRIAPMRNSVESDPYGFVAFVLSVEHGCTHAQCGRFSLLRDPARVRENMRVRRFEAYLAKHSTGWRGASDLPADRPAASERRSSPIVTISGDPAPGMPASEVSPTPEAEPVAEATNEPPSLPLILPLVPPPSSATVAAEPPAAAAAPVVNPAEEDDFSAPPVRADASEAADAAKGEPADPKGAAEAGKGAARATNTQAKSKAKARPANPASRPSAEPVAGLPRVVPSDYLRDREPQEEAQTQTAAPAAGAPTPITPPRQNFIGN